jgi:hypothetical protein
MFHTNISRPVRLALAAAIACFALLAQTKELTAPVIAISDGDTIRVHRKP